MKTKTYKLKDLEKVVIGLGYVGENDHTRVVIDAGEVFGDHPQATVGMAVVPPMGERFPVTVSRDGDNVEWTVKNSVLVCDGDGLFQLTFVEGSEIIKSCRGRFRVKESIPDGGVAPDPIQDWIDEANEVVEEAREAAAAAEHQPRIGQDGYWEIWDLQEEAYVTTGVKAQGEQGDPGPAGEDGAPGQDGHTPEKGVDYWTEQDRAAMAADVVSDVIDDTAGDGDTNKTWSADKLDGEFEDVKTDITKKPDIKGSNKTGVDLDLSDPGGNVIARFKNGAFFTERFASNPNIITVKKDGTGDFTTLKAATESITDNDPVTNPYEIHIYPGTYDTLEGYTDAEIRAADIGGGYTPDSMVGVKLKDGVSLIGIGNRESIILTAELSTTDYGIGVRGNISTLNLHGNGRIENLTIMAKAIRYCVHDDFQYLKRYTRIVKNCAFIPVGMSMSSNPATTYGSGMREAGVDALFENCDFGSFFGMHTKTGMTGNGIVIFNHCKGLGLRLGDTAAENDAAKHTFYVNGCDFRSIKINRDTATTPHIFVEGVNNKNAMVFCGSADNPHIANMLKTYPTSVPIGTLVTIGAGELTATSDGIKAVAASDIESALGVLVDRDAYFDYIQTEGYIPAKSIGISSGLSVGDFITVDGNMKLTGGGTSANAVGVVKYTDSNDNAQILLLGR